MFPEYKDKLNFGPSGIQARMLSHIEKTREVALQAMKLTEVVLMPRRS